MRLRTLLFTVVIFGLGWFAATASAAEVSQGKCVTYDKAANQLTIEEYDLQFSADTPYGKPTGVLSIFNMQTAEIGVPPEPGDILRLSWINENGSKKALKIMNVSKQSLRK